MHSLRRWPAVAAAVVLLLAGGVSASATQGGPRTPSSVVVEVQTYNLYFGADLTPLFTSTDPVAAASVVWAQMQASMIPQRVRAVAELIAEQQPDLVGLQEVSTWRSAPASLTPAGPAPTGPFVTDYDAADLLLGDLADLGAAYQVVVANTNFSNEAFPLPVVTTSGLRLATFTDRDVILVRRASLSRGGITVADSDSHTFTATLRVSVAGTEVAVPRGYSTADIAVRGRTFRFANTHLEAYGSPPLQDQVRNPQAAELATALEGSPHPVVLVGDINARPTMCRDARLGQPQWPADQNVVAYATLQDAGLSEVWPLVHRKDPCGAAGWTSGQDTLDGPDSTLDHRIDDVFLSKGFTALDAQVVGDEQADRTASGLWPSDHASTWARIRLASAARSH